MFFGEFGHIINQVVLIIYAMVKAMGPNDYGIM